MNRIVYRYGSFVDENSDPAPMMKNVIGYVNCSGFDAKARCPDLVWCFCFNNTISFNTQVGHLAGHCDNDHRLRLFGAGGCVIKLVHFNFIGVVVEILFYTVRKFHCFLVVALAILGFVERCFFVKVAACNVDNKWVIPGYEFFLS